MEYDLNTLREGFQKYDQRADANSESKDFHRANTVASNTFDYAGLRHPYMKTTTKHSDLQNAEDYNDPWQQIQTVQSIPPTKEHSMLFFTGRLHRS
jgi:hypothetical protein